MTARDGAVSVHAAALCESTKIGAGTRIWAFAHVMPDAVIGENCNVCDHVFVEDGAIIGNRVTVKNNVLVWRGVTIGDDVFVGPNVVFTNDRTPRAHTRKSHEDLVPTWVASGATVGANATVVCGVRIGEDAFVAAGSVVTRDVRPHGFVAGNPARMIGWACRCGNRLGPDLRCTCGRRYRPQPDGAGLSPDDRP